MPSLTNVRPVNDLWGPIIQPTKLANRSPVDPLSRWKPWLTPYWAFDTSYVRVTSLGSVPISRRACEQYPDFVRSADGTASDVGVRMEVVYAGVYYCYCVGLLWLMRQTKHFGALISINIIYYLCSNTDFNMVKSRMPRHSHNLLMITTIVKNSFFKMNYHPETTCICV